MENGVGESMDWGCVCVGYLLLALSTIPLGFFGFTYFYKEKLEMSMRHPVVIVEIAAFLALLVVGIIIVIIRS
jgi:hypothetical protein